MNLYLNFYLCCKINVSRLPILRTQTKKCLDGLDKYEKYVFINNKPKAVIIDLKVYEAMKVQLKETYQLVEMNPKDVSPELRSKIAETKKMSKQIPFADISYKEYLPVKFG